MIIYIYQPICLIYILRWFFIGVCWGWCRLSASIGWGGDWCGLFVGLTAVLRAGMCWGWVCGLRIFILFSIFFNLFLFCSFTFVFSTQNHHYSVSDELHPTSLFHAYFPSYSNTKTHFPYVYFHEIANTLTHAYQLTLHSI